MFRFVLHRCQVFSSFNRKWNAFGLLAVGQATISSLRIYEVTSDEHWLYTYSLNSSAFRRRPSLSTLPLFFWDEKKSKASHRLFNLLIRHSDSIQLISNLFIVRAWRGVILGLLLLLGFRLLPLCILSFALLLPSLLLLSTLGFVLCCPLSLSVWLSSVPKREREGPFRQKKVQTTDCSRRRIGDYNCDGCDRLNIAASTHENSPLPHRLIPFI